MDLLAWAFSGVGVVLLTSGAGVVRRLWRTWRPAPAPPVVLPEEIPQAWVDQIIAAMAGRSPTPEPPEGEARSAPRPTAARRPSPPASAHGRGSGDASARRTLAAAIANLPHDQQTLLALKYAEGLSQSQAAAVVGISESEALSATQAALLALRAALGVELTE